MLPFLKKKSDAAAAPLLPSWHPNFRNYEKLPDIKVVRTAFFVNGAALFLAVALAIYFGFQQWQLHVFRVQIAESQAQIDRDKPKSDKAKALFTKFTAEEAKILEADAFVKSKTTVSDLIVHLGQTLPRNIAIEGIDLRDGGLSLRLTVRGDSQAPSYANAYWEQLKSDKALSRFEEATVVTSTRNQSTGRLAVDMFLKVRPAAPAPAPKK